jgi:hypothetical protein
MLLCVARPHIRILEVRCKISTTRSIVCLPKSSTIGCDTVRFDAMQCDAARAGLSELECGLSHGQRGSGGDGERDRNESVGCAWR